MKLDWDCVRELLLSIENLGDENSTITGHDLAGYDAANVNYHIELLAQAGLIVGGCIQPLGGDKLCRANNMTWHGHELLSSIRKNTVWNEVKRTARQKGVSLSLDIVMQIAKAVVLGALK